MRNGIYPFLVDQPFVLLYATYFNGGFSNLKESYEYYKCYDWYADFLKKYLIDGVN